MAENKNTGARGISDRVPAQLSLILFYHNSQTIYIGKGANQSKRGLGVWRGTHG